METKNELNPKQLRFCQLYVTEEFFGNGVAAYVEAYGIDIKKSGAYHSARTCAHRLLTNVDILKQINSLLDTEGLNDQFVDKQLLLTITQNSDLGAKMAAIREYNKLRARITDKVHIQVTKLGKDLAEEKYEE